MITTVSSSGTDQASSRYPSGQQGDGSTPKFDNEQHKPGAAHTHANTANFLVGDKQAHYLFVVKANQPTLLDRLTCLAWHRVPVGDRTRDQAHGRVELRTLKAITVNHFGFPHAAQAIQITRKTRDLGARRWHTVVVYAITSLSFAQARPPGWPTSSAGTG